MSDELRDLLESVRTLSSIEEGNIDLDMFRRYRRVCGKDATGSLVVPWPLTDYGLSRTQAAEVWESIWSDPEALSAWAAYLEAERIKWNIPLPEPAKLTPNLPELPAPAKTRLTGMKSLARRLLCR